MSLDEKDENGLTDQDDSQPVPLTGKVSIKSIIAGIETNQTISEIPNIPVDDNNEEPVSESVFSEFTSVSELPESTRNSVSVSVNNSVTKISEGATNSTITQKSPKNHRAIEVIAPPVKGPIGYSSAVASATSFDASKVNRQMNQREPMAMMMNVGDIEAMFNEAVLEALREMATQSMQQAVDKSAQEEVFASMKRATLERNPPYSSAPATSAVQPKQAQHHLLQDQVEIINPFPELEIKPFNLTLEREIVHDETAQPPLGNTP